MTPDRPDVAVVIVFRNAADTLAASIASARGQEGVRTEIVCVDDASTDASAEIARRALEGSGGVLVSRPEQGGAPAARNLGLERVRAPAVQFLDADDVLLPGKLERQSRLLAADGAAFVAGAYWYVDAEGERALRSPHADPWLGVLASSLGRTSSNLFRTDAVRGVGGWATHMESSQDAELMFRLLKEGHRCAVDGEPGATIQLTPGSISQADGSAMRFLRLRREMMMWLDERGELTPERRVAAAAACFRVTLDLPAEQRAGIWRKLVTPFLEGSRE